MASFHRERQSWINQSFLSRASEPSLNHRRLVLNDQSAASANWITACADCSAHPRLWASQAVGKKMAASITEDIGLIFYFFFGSVRRVQFDVTGGINSSAAAIAWDAKMYTELYGVWIIPAALHWKLLIGHKHWAVGERQQANALTHFKQANLPCCSWTQW